MIILIITCILTFVYISLIIILFYGLNLIKPAERSHRYRVSIVVAARNEEKNIGDCLIALLNQTYSMMLYEIIIVDDRSTDSTSAIVQSYCRQYPQVRLLQVRQLPSGYAGKKYALETGINAATGEIILTTDADCIPGPSWIQGMINYFEPEVGIVAGFSPLIKSGRENIFSRLMTLDSMALAAVAAGSFGLGNPITCNGRNLGYRKAAFQSVNGFQEIQNFVSGDDDLLLHLVRTKTNWKARYSIDQQTFVQSKIPENFQQFANQRIRHASKGRYYSFWLKLALVMVYLLNLNLIILMPVAILSMSSLIPWLCCWLTKSLSEFFLIYRIAHLFNYKKALIVFPIAMLLHPFYVVIFGLWGQLGKFYWKDSRHSTKTN